MMYHDGWRNGMGGNGGWWTIPMMVMMIVFWGGLIWIALNLTKRTHAVPPPHAPAPTAAPAKFSPEEVLADRLARGEIEPDEYHKRLAALRTHANS